jgi:hypothetical protein
MEDIASAVPWRTLARVGIAAASAVVVRSGLGPQFDCSRPLTILIQLLGLIKEIQPKNTYHVKLPHRIREHP